MTQHRNPEMMSALRELTNSSEPHLSVAYQHLAEGVVTEPELDWLRDLVSEHLLREGFNEEWEPTYRGKILEDLIDHLAPWQHGFG